LTVELKDAYKKGSIVYPQSCTNYDYNISVPETLTEIMTLNDTYFHIHTNNTTYLGKHEIPYTIWQTNKTEKELGKFKIVLIVEKVVVPVDPELGPDRNGTGNVTVGEERRSREFGRMAVAVGGAVLKVATNMVNEGIKQKTSRGQKAIKVQ
jgi:hypothetical protein